MEDVGFHTLWDITGANTALLRDEQVLHRFFYSALLSSGFTVIDDLMHKFELGGEGVTGLFLLSESHLSYHTYPENNYISIDVYTCGRSNDAINNDIRRFFGEQANINCQTFRRGSCPPRREEHGCETCR
ncbi:adenosylmethionine decarboxylase [Pseudomonas sp. NY15372]|uniref:adenosylmethionine decarboxylase n=1 Tax=unclassified Pseudomonas TaxID=196821 RepID=UPI0018A93C67|nr:adenosylmethionine decarboxylase [Pseudomonas sp. p1(2021b)]MBF8792489.1 adenosylmethionine decarboxylase [Pseudomonas monteilii]UBM27323.1 adenosylmethionine decarboxylase [Pseudomonas sp. p1(2021b)]